MDPFAGIAGNEIPKTFFSNFLENNEKMPHALLLRGPRGIGKFALAFKFSLALNCRSNERPCGECTDCRQILGGTSPDVLISSSHREIKAEQMRSLVNEVVITPRERRIRIVILDDFDRINETGANIFLKTLEEPPSHLRFILITSNPGKLLPTIISRCIPIDFRPTSESICGKFLADIYPSVSRDVISKAASGGRFGLAVRQIYAALKSNGISEPEGSYAGYIARFTTGLLTNTQPGFAYHLKEIVSALMDSVEDEWKAMDSFPKGMDAVEIRKFVECGETECNPVNYLEQDEDKARKLKEYDKAKIIVGDLKRRMYMELKGGPSADEKRRGLILRHLNILREIERDLAGHRNIELSFEKLLTRAALQSG